MLGRILDIVHANNALNKKWKRVNHLALSLSSQRKAHLQDGVRLAVVRRRGHHARAVDHENASHQRDVLPDFGLPRNRRDFAHTLGPQRVDDGAFSDVRISHKTHTVEAMSKNNNELAEHTPDLFFVAVKLRVLAQELDERALSKRVGNAGVEGQRRELFAEQAHPAGCHPWRHEIALVQQEQEMLVRKVGADLLLNMP
jgi:hypothetical protein